MGYEISLAWAGLPQDLRPNWDAASKAIDTLDFESVWAQEEAAFPWEDWLADVPNPPDPRGKEVALASARAKLHEDLGRFRQETERRFSRELATIRIRDVMLFITGGPTVGESPTELHNPIWRLTALGILRAAGFIEPATSRDP